MFCLGFENFFEIDFWIFFFFLSFFFDINLNSDQIRIMLYTWNTVLQDQFECVDRSDQIHNWVYRYGFYRDVHVWFEIQINFDNYLQIYSWILDLNLFALSSCFGLLYCNLQVSSCDLKLSCVVMHSVHHQCQEQHSPFSHTPKIFFFF